MARSYMDLLTKATKQRLRLDQAIADGNQKEILRLRGRYLLTLKQAHKLNPTGNVPPQVTGYSALTPISDVISTELNNHQNYIDSCLRANKRNSSIKNYTLAKEVGLKLRRLSTRADQVNFATNAATRNSLKQEMAKDSAGMVGTAIKAPIMVGARVLNKAGPVVISLFFLPFKAVSALLSVTLDISNGNTKSDISEYNNTVVHQLSHTLEDAVRNVSKTIYNNTGRF